MVELFAENDILRLVLMIVLFAVVAGAAYFIAQAVSTRQLARRRLLEPAVAAPSVAIGSLRAEQIQSAWLRLVNSIEKRGLSLVDTKDAALRQKLIAAGWSAPHAPRVYTLIRLVLVIGLPVLASVLFWVTGSRSPCSRRLL